MGFLGSQPARYSMEPQQLLPTAEVPGVVFRYAARQPVAGRQFLNEYVLVVADSPEGDEEFRVQSNG
jgi:hypothetical protein